LSRLNPLHELSHPLGKLEQSMGRMERSIGQLHDDMEPTQVLPEVLASLHRVEALMERLITAVEADAASLAVPVKPRPPAGSRRAAPRVREA
jgi:hypothetical protein